MRNAVYCLLLVSAHSHKSLFVALGRRVRSLREERAVSQRVLADQAGLSLRFLADVEAGNGNISIGRLADLAEALGVPLTTLVKSADAASADPRTRDRVIALLGLRGAGKSTVGRALAKQLGRSFVELDDEIETRASLRLAEIFEIHGEAYYRRLERELLRELLASGKSLVLATGGGLVSDADTWSLLREGARTVWLRAAPEDHWARVLQQGDGRPMADRPRAMIELRANLAARSPLYAKAEFAIDTSTGARRIEALVAEIARSLATL